MKESGPFWGTGTNGVAWAASSTGSASTMGTRLNFNSTNVNPLNAPYRADGCPVRCVQEPTGVL